MTSSSMMAPRLPSSCARGPRLCTTTGAGWRRHHAGRRLRLAYLNNPARGPITNRPVCSVILYEYPFNERVRAYLRLAYLFARLFYFALDGVPRHTQIALATLFDINDATDSTDIQTPHRQSVV